MKKIRIKKLVNEAIIPTYAKDGDAGMDLYAVSAEGSPEHGFVEYGIGIAVEIPKGYVGLIFPRSSISKKSSMFANSVGVIDSGYRGEIKVRMKPDTSAIHAANNENLAKIYEFSVYGIGERVAQLIIMPIPHIEFEEVDELEESERGEGGFGSTNTAEHPISPDECFKKEE